MLLMLLILLALLWNRNSNLAVCVCAHVCVCVCACVCVFVCVAVANSHAFKYLGVHITKDEKTWEILDFQDKITECKSKLNMWLQMDLTVFGRTLFTKMESLAKCIHPAYSMPILSSQFIKANHQLNFNFIWKNRVHYIKKSEIVQDYEDGDLKAIDFECLNHRHYKE